MDTGGSGNWVGPAVRLNSTGTQGYAVMVRGGANDVRLYRVDHSLGSPVMVVSAGTAVDGKTVRIEATGSLIEVFVDGVLKLTWAETGTLFTGTGHRNTGVLGNNAGFDDFLTVGEVTATTTNDTVVRVHHRMAGELLGTTIDGEFTATVTDHLGSGATTRTFDGTTVTQAYTPFGVIRGGGTNSLLTDMTFTGQTDDPGTGLIDFNARAYDPVLGRFVMGDTVLVGSGQNSNRYSYVYNSPTGLVDPTGHWPDLINIDIGEIGEGIVSVAEGATGLASDAWAGTDDAINEVLDRSLGLCLNAGSAGDSCDSVVEAHTDGSQRIANYAAGVEKGVLFGEGDRLLDSIGLSGNYDANSTDFAIGNVSGVVANAAAGGGFSAVSTYYLSAGTAGNSYDFLFPGERSSRSDAIANQALLMFTWWLPSIVTGPLSAAGGASATSSAQVWWATPAAEVVSGLWTSVSTYAYSGGGGSPVQ